jgi:hypothetical protein
MAGRHAASRGSGRGKRSVARFAIPVVVGVVVFGGVTAFAATLSVSSKSLGSGNATVSSCNAAATVSYTTAYASTIPGYKVATTPVTTAAGCATMAYKVTLTGSGNASLAEVTGTLDASGNASPDFSASNIAAANVTGVSVVVTG